MGIGKSTLVLLLFYAALSLDLLSELVFKDNCYRLDRRIGP